MGFEGNFEAACARTAARGPFVLKKGVLGAPTSSPDMHLLHAAMGMATEAGEFLDALKKSIFYGAPLDVVNLKEEIGDILWYLAIACLQLGTTIEAEQKRVLAKLQARYGEGFSQERALKRDLNAERDVLSRDPS